MSDTNTTPDPYAGLRDRAMTDQETWQPTQVDELLAGEVVRVDTVQFRDGSPKTVVTLRRASTDPALDGIEISPGTGTVLQRAYAELGLQAGDLVVVRYLGEQPGRMGQAYKNFRVEADRDGKRVARKATAAGPVGDLDDGLLPGPPPLHPSEEPF